MITRSEALEFLHKNLQSPNLRRHCYAVEAVMRALAIHFKEDPEMWGVAGLLHDADYEVTKDDAKRHTHLVLEWLTDHDIPQEVKSAILSHGWGYVEGNAEPITKMEWSLYCCDELTGFIVAVALVRPEKTLSSVTVDSVLSKWKQNGFAKGVTRAQVEMCTEKLEIPFSEFVKIALGAMQEISSDLGL